MQDVFHRKHSILNDEEEILFIFERFDKIVLKKLSQVDEYQQ